ncbi:hypothetical protein M2116_000357 [Aurantimicrobium minutum]|uniref:hypothetical protein n=1 Tax=Aurantimicrobium minutum TaxID=708131 RepID=UPI0024068A4E|nr:hypothetical protein [Aurantimicrobium minutum]MDF9809420.1 hypothetical protein [Aurantimicrobium minutum]
MTASKKTNITSIVLLVVTVLSALVLFVPSLMLAMVSDSCSSCCNMAVFTLGYYIAVIGTPLVAVTGVIFTIIKMVKKQDAVSFALIGLGGTYGAFMLGLAITFITASIK